jgi:hypothetical protein
MPQTPDDDRNEFVERFDALDRQERLGRLREARILHDGDTRRLLLPFDATVDSFALGLVLKPCDVRITPCPR